MVWCLEVDWSSGQDPGRSWDMPVSWVKTCQHHHRDLRFPEQRNTKHNTPDTSHILPMSCYVRSVSSQHFIIICMILAKSSSVAMLLSVFSLISSDWLDLTNRKYRNHVFVVFSVYSSIVGKKNGVAERSDFIVLYSLTHIKLYKAKYSQCPPQVHKYKHFSGSHCFYKNPSINIIHSCFCAPTSNIRIQRRPGLQT